MTKTPLFWLYYQKRGVIIIHVVDVIDKELTTISFNRIEFVKNLRKEVFKMFDPIKEQQKLFDTWNENMQKVMTPNFDFMKNNMMPKFEDMQKMFPNNEAMIKMYNDMQENAKKMYEGMQENAKALYANVPGYNEYMKQFEDMFPKMDNYAKLFEVKMPGLEMYNQLLDFYKGLVNPTDFAKTLQDNFNRVVTAFIQNSIPNGTVADMFKQPQEIVENCVKFYENMMKPWVALDEDLVQRVLKGDVNAYIDFFNQISDKYEATFGKVVKMMNMGINLEIADENQRALDAYYKMMFAAGKLSSILLKSNNDNTQALMEKYQEMVKDGQKVSTFKEFYDLWYNINETAMETLFDTDVFAKAFSEFTDKYFIYMSAQNAVLERNLAKLPIPTNKDMNSLYLTVYNLRKDVRDLKREIEAMKEKTEAAKAEKK